MFCASVTLNISFFWSIYSCIDCLLEVETALWTRLPAVFPAVNCILFFAIYIAVAIMPRCLAPKMGSGIFSCLLGEMSLSLRRDNGALVVAVVFSKILADDDDIRSDFFDCISFYLVINTSSSFRGMNGDCFWSNGISCSKRRPNDRPSLT